MSYFHGCRVIKVPPKKVAPNSSGSLPVIVPVVMTIEEGNLYVTYNKDIAVSFELDEADNLYASYDDELGISFELDDSGNLYMLEG